MFYDAAGNLRESFPGEFRNYGYNPQPTNPQQQAQGAGGMSPPIRRVEIILADSMEEIERTNVAAGTSQMFGLKDDSALVIKSAGQNGQGYTLTVYAKLPPEQVKKKSYVTYEEMESTIRAAISAALSQKEDAKNGTV